MDKQLNDFLILAARDQFGNPFEELSIIKTHAKLLLKERKKENDRQTKTGSASKRSQSFRFRIFKRS